MTANDDMMWWSPDLGRYAHCVVRSGRYYFENGKVLDRPPTLMRWGPSRPLQEGEENFADWTDAERAARVTRVAREAEEERALYEQQKAKTETLVASARSKVTEDEWEALGEYWNDR